MTQKRRDDEGVVVFGYPHMPGFVSFVGAGPGDPELLTLAGRRRLQRAEVVIADYLAHPDLLLHCPPSATVIQRVRGLAGGPRLQQPEVNALLLEHARAGRYVVRLKGGDSFMFGRGAEEAQVLHAAGIGFEFIPGVSSPIAAPEAAGIPVTHRDHTPAVTFVSGFEAYDKAGLHVEWQHLARGAGTLVLMMSVKNARDNAQRLIEAGRSPQTPAAMVRWGTRGLQRTIVATLETIADHIEAAGLRAPSVLVVGDVVALRNQLQWLEQRPLFGKRVVLTRAADQNVAMAEALRDQGADVMVVPSVRIDPPLDPTAFDRHVATLASYDGIIVSSHTGVDAFFDALERNDLDARALAGTCVVAIGRRTAQACRARGIRPDLVPGEQGQRSEGIAALLASHGRLQQRWLHIRAENGRPQLGQAITAAGGTYTLAVAYRIERPPISEHVRTALLDPPSGDGCDAICFASVKTAQNFIASFDEGQSQPQAVAWLNQRRILSLGPVTTDGLEALGLRVHSTSASPRPRDLQHAIEQALTHP